MSADPAPTRRKAALPSYLLLDVARYLDHKSIQRLRCASKEIRALLDAYEKGVVKSNIADAFQDVLEHLGPYGILSTRPGRPAVTETSFLMIGELEDRREKIDYLAGRSFLGPYWVQQCELSGLPNGPHCMESVHRRLTRALWICCDLADCDLAYRHYPNLINQKPSCKDKSACVYHNGQAPPPSSSSSPAAPSRRAADDKPVDLGGGYGARMLSEAANNQGRAGYFEPTTYVPLHQRVTKDAHEQREEHLRRRQLLEEQKQLLSCSSTEDLASLLVLAHLVEAAFVDLTSAFQLLPNLDLSAQYEWTIAAAENTLRHGIFFAFPQCQLAYAATLGRHTSGLGTPGQQDDATQNDAVEDQNRQGHAIQGMTLSGKPASGASGMYHCGGCCCEAAEKWSNMLCDVVDEIHQFELGFEDALPGLVLIIRRELVKRLDLPIVEVDRQAVEIVAAPPPAATEDMAPSSNA